MTAQEILAENQKKKNNAMQALDDFKNYYNNYKNNTNRVKTNDALNSYNSANNNYNNIVNQGYKPSDNVNNALNQSNQWANEMANMGKFEYDNKYDDKISELLNKFENNKFSYDINNDPLYQQLAENFQQKGKQAMIDTMGQASAMTGGYGSSYASSVGQQAYQQNLNELNSVAPQLMDMAYNHYNNQQNQTLQLSQFYSDLDKGDFNKALSSYQTNMDRYKGMMDHYQNQYQYMDSSEREDYRVALDAAYKQMQQAYGVYEGALNQDNYENSMQSDIAKAKADQANKDYDYAREMAMQMANQANVDREYTTNQANKEKEYNFSVSNANREYELAMKKLGLENGISASSGASGNTSGSKAMSSPSGASAVKPTGYTSEEILALGYGPITQSYLETLISKGEVKVDKNGKLTRTNKSNVTQNNPFSFMGK